MSGMVDHYDDLWESSGGISPSVQSILPTIVDAGLKTVSKVENDEELGVTSLMFSMHPTMESRAIERVCSEVEKVFHYASNSLGN